MHGYVGFLTAPMVLFFALSGMIQVLNLHQPHDGYQPPAVVAAIANLHKDQILSRPHRPFPPGPGGLAPRDAGDEKGRFLGRPPPPPPPGLPGFAPPRGGDEAASPKVAVVLLKAFVLLAAASLVVSILIGLWIGLTDRLRRPVHLGLLAIGVVAPLVLVAALR